MYGGISSTIGIIGNLVGPLRTVAVAYPLSLTAAAGAAGALTGTYFYRVSFVTAAGETEAGIISPLVSPVAQRVELTNIPCSVDPAVTARKIYRTLANGTVIELWLVATLSDNTTTIFSDNVADGSLGVAAPWINTTGGGRLFLNGVGFAHSSEFSTGFGVNALAVSRAHGSVAFGSGALKANTVGYFNTAVGHTALELNTTGHFLVALGYGALRLNTSGISNTAIGTSALYSNTTGNYNTAVGLDASEFNTAGTENVTVGMRAGWLTTTGSQNTVVGTQALRQNQTGGSNCAFGYNALNVCSVGNNTALGTSALLSTTTGTENVAVGGVSLPYSTTGSFNTALGKDAGRYQADGATVLALTGSNNVYIGYNVKGFNNSDSNSIVIGSAAIGAGANSCVLGNDAILKTVLKGNVLVGLAAAAGASAVGVLVINNSTPPSAMGTGLQIFNGPAGVFGVFQTIDPAAAVAAASTHKIRVRWNGVDYYLLATTVP